MFYNFKHRFGEKSKRAAALLVTVAMLCGFTGCGKNETSSSAPLSSSSVTQSIPADKSTINSDNTGSSGTQSVQNNGQSNFDFDEAVKNINLFGQKISLPCYWSDFGEDFSHDEMYIPSGDDLMCWLLYKGKKIGNIFFADCADAETTAEVESHPIVCFDFGFTDYGPPYNSGDLKFFETMDYYTDILELGVGDISMSSTENDIMAELGEPSSIGGDVADKHYINYDYDNGYLSFRVNGSSKGNIIKLYINVYSN